MRTCSGVSPAAAAALARSTVWNWVPVQMSHWSAPSATRQFKGSMGACARYGIW
jgi:hypothetical protein